MCMQLSSPVFCCFLGILLSPIGSCFSIMSCLSIDTVYQEKIKSVYIMIVKCFKGCRQASRHLARHGSRPICHAFWKKFLLAISKIIELAIFKLFRQFVCFWRWPFQIMFKYFFYLYKLRLPHNTTGEVVLLHFTNYRINKEQLSYMYTCTLYSTYM